VCGIVPGSVDPKLTGIEAGLSAVGDIFEAIARRAGTTVNDLSKEIVEYRSGQTGLLRLSWDNGDRTVLVNPELGGITLNWHLTNTAADELFASIEGTAFHSRIILERMEEHGTVIKRVINGGGIPKKNDVLNQVYANVLKKPILVPQGDVTSLGSAIFAFVAAGAFKSIAEAQKSLCPPFKTYQPNATVTPVNDQLYELYRKIYFGFGQRTAAPVAIGDVLPELRRIVIFTFGNASGIDRESGRVAIKPSGVPYEKLKPEHIVVTDLDGKLVEGDLRPSSDLATHLALYRTWETVGGVVHTHSRYATAWAQAKTPIPCFGTTHADYFHGPLPVTRVMTAAEVDSDYELNTGLVIVERFRDIDPLGIPAVLVSGHAPFCWGTNVTEAAHTAAVVEELAHMALLTVTIDAEAKPISDSLRKKHFGRKHGPEAYYGQPDN
jgi:L-ribulose-5-phosphate 4-epimerase